MQSACVAIIKNGILEPVYCIYATDQGIVSSGKYAGQQLSHAVENLFYEHCRKVNPDLPTTIPNEEEELPDDFPDLDTGSYEFDDTEVLITWPLSV